MTTLFFFVGLGLGSLCGFLLALLILHGRAQSLAEEMVMAQRAGERAAEGYRSTAPPSEWRYARPLRTGNGLAQPRPVPFSHPARTVFTSGQNGAIAP